MKTVNIDIEIPEYLTIKQYQDVNKYKALDSQFDKLVKTVTLFTDLSYEQIRDMPVDTLRQIAKDIDNISQHNDEFHAIVEFNGKIYGYQDIKASSLGSYIDLENFCKEDMDKNLHKIAALLYRPVVKNTLGGYKWTVKQTIKLAKNSVENVFDYYTIEPYDSEKRKEREKEFLDFPVHILLGALGFFLGSASMYLANIAYSMNPDQITPQAIKMTEKKILQGLSSTIGDGLQLFTNSQKPLFFKLQGTSQ